jgi:hypothetical protein
MLIVDRYLAPAGGSPEGVTPDDAILATVPPSVLRADETKLKDAV